MDEGAYVHFLCSRSGGDVVSNFRPLLPRLAAAVPGQLFAGRQDVIQPHTHCGCGFLNGPPRDKTLPFFGDFCSPAENEFVCKRIDESPTSSHKMGYFIRG